MLPLQITIPSLDFFVCFSFLVFFLFNINYNEYNTIIEHVSLPVPTMDNRLVQIYKYRSWIHNKKIQTYTDIHSHTESWTKYFVDMYLHCTLHVTSLNCCSHFKSLRFRKSDLACKWSQLLLTIQDYDNLTVTHTHTHTHTHKVHISLPLGQRNTDKQCSLWYCYDFVFLIQPLLLPHTHSYIHS